MDFLSAMKHEKNIIWMLTEVYKEWEGRTYELNNWMEAKYELNCEYH